MHHHAPDVAIVDIKMPPTYTDEGLTAAPQIRAECPSTAVLVLSLRAAQLRHPAHPNLPGTNGDLLKDRVTDSALLLGALRRLAEGECVVDPTIVARCMTQRANEPTEPDSMR